MSDPDRQDGNGLTTLLGLIVFTIVPLAISALLFYLLYLVPNARIAQAENWVEVPCEVEYVELNGSSLDVYYKYDFDGKSYEGHRYDLTVGRMR